MGLSVRLLEWVYMNTASRAHVKFKPTGPRHARMARAGHSIPQSARAQPNAAVEGAAKVREVVPAAAASGGDNATVVAGANIVFLTVPIVEI